MRGIGVALIQSVWTPFARLESFAFSAAPKCCSSSMMTSPRSANFTSFEARACVPTTTFNFPRRSPSFVSLVSGSRRGPRQASHLDAERTEPLAEGRDVLPGENGCRHCDGDLFARERDGRGRAQRDLGLAEADVAADDPIHGMTGREIVQNVLDRPRLVDRREIWKARDESLVGRPRSDELGSAPAAPLGDMFGKLLGRGLDFPLGLAASLPPRTSVRLVERQLAEFCRVRPDQSEIGGRNQSGIVACELRA